MFLALRQKLRLKLFLNMSSNGAQRAPGTPLRTLPRTPPFSGTLSGHFGPEGPERLLQQVRGVVILENQTKTLDPFGWSQVSRTGTSRTSMPSVGPQGIALFSLNFQRKLQFKKSLGRHLEVPDILLPGICDLLILGPKRPEKIKTLKKGKSGKYPLTQIITYEKSFFSEIIIFEKLRISHVISGKVLAFPEILRK